MNQSPSSVLLCVVSFLLIAATAAAQLPAGSSTTFEDEITVTATGEESQADEVPGPVTVITRQEMEDAGGETVVDLLRRVPGVTVMQQGGDGSLSTIFTRGTESDQTLVLLDGVRLNSPYFGGYDWSQLATAGLEQIEVVRGPYSALYGAEAIGGVVNLITGRADHGWHGGLAAEGGSGSWQRYQGSLSYAGNNLDLSLTGFDRQGSGELDNSDFSGEEWLLNLGWTFGRNLDSRVGLIVQDLANDTGIPTSYGLPTPNRHQWNEQRLVAVPLSWQVTKDWSVQLSAAEVSREYRFSDPDDPWSPWSDTQADSTEARLSSRHRLGRHVLTWGGEWRRDEVDSRELWGPVLDNESVTVSSAFIQDAWQPNDRLSLVAGLRWDDADAWGSELSPRLNLGWKLRDGWELRASVGTAFRQPSVGELYSIFGNPELEAETSTSSELGLVRRHEHSRWQLSVFSSDLEQLIGYDYVTMGLYNVDEARVRGAEFGYDLLITDGASMALQLTYLDTEDTSTGSELLRRPQWSGSWTLSGQLWRKLRGDLTLLWIGERDDVDPVSFATVSADSFTTADLALAWEVTERTELTLRARNLTDEEYQEVLGFPAPGRRYYGGLRWAF